MGKKPLKFICEKELFSLEVQYALIGVFQEIGPHFYGRASLIGCFNIHEGTTN